MSDMRSFLAAEQLTHLLSWFRLLKNMISGARFASRIPVAGRASAWWALNVIHYKTESVRFFFGGGL